ncbi:porin [Methylonatrum kenyense]|uniref:porin n=1 Tax=Methylonatrum kenyense TaxID=455253 RepID=UPI0020BFA328|nr:porin [Methylonatrum kenyense]MCK8517197.1 porin [Methylonatrum kenyense]
MKTKTGMRFLEDDRRSKQFSRPLTATVGSLGLALTVIASPTVEAGPTIEMGPNQNMNLMFAFRGAFTAVEDGAPSGDDYSKDFTAENTRLYIWGDAGERLGYTFHVERDAEGSLQILDAIAQFELSDPINIWVGRFLPPSDRANLAAPLFPVTFNFPAVHAFPSEFAGRVEGAMLWGSDSEGRGKYSVAVSDGIGSSSDGPNQRDRLMYSGRLEYNFWDGQPGYYPMAWYDGAKRILALGGSVRYQENAAGTADDSGDFLGWNVDFRIEYPFGDGSSFDFEAAYYDYDIDDIADPNLIQGSGYYLSAGYKFPQKIGIGFVEPRIDYQNFDRSRTNVSETRGTFDRLDVGFRYLIRGHNIRVDVFGSRENPGPSQDRINSFTTRVHFVF